MAVYVELKKKPEGVVSDKKIEDLKDGRIIQNITFFGDAAIPAGDPIYEAVKTASKTLAKEGYTIVDGGGPGIMKAATDGAEEVDGTTIAVYWEPKLAGFFEGKNLENIVDSSTVESNYIMRTFGLIEKGDVFVVCKGGTGTISEFGLVWCLGKLYYGCHKPVILYGDFWDELIEAFQKTMYIDEVEMAVLHRAKTPEELVELIKSFEVMFAHCKVDGRKGVESNETAFLINGRFDKTLETYQKIASEYHSSRVGKLVSQEQLDEFISFVHAPAKVIDIGCGPGHDMTYLSQKYAVDGIDYSPRFVDIAKLNNPDSNIIMADIVQYDLGKEKYKGVWSRDTIHHIKAKDLDLVFKKIADSLVEGGIFYCIVREGTGEILEQERKSYAVLDRFYHLFTTEELLDRAEKAGLKLVKIDHIQKSHKWLVGVFKK
ncbi:MAG: methyltransferase domain-containing protein [Candidatus Dojkabacteria bacterium]